MMTTRARSGSSRGRAIGEAPLEAGIAHGRQEPREMLVAIGAVVDVQLADDLLPRAPHRLAKVAHDAHEPQRGGAARRRRLLEVGLEQPRLVSGPEAVVDREVAEVEETVAHPGVLPVDDADALAVVEE